MLSQDIKDIEWIDGALNLFQVPSEDSDGGRLSEIARVALAARDRKYFLHVIEKSIELLEKAEKSFNVANRHDAYCELTIQGITDTICLLKKAVQESQEIK